MFFISQRTTVLARPKCIAIGVGGRHLPDQEKSEIIRAPLFLAGFTKLFWRRSFAWKNYLDFRHNLEGESIGIFRILGKCQG